MDCPSPQCRQNSINKSLFLFTRGSIFDKFQSVHIQELSSQVPIGQLPRSLLILMKNDLVRKIIPGTTITISGTYLPRPYVGMKRMRAPLLADTYIECYHIEEELENYKNTSIDKKIQVKKKYN